MSRVCSKCGEEKEDDLFRKQRRACKECERKQDKEYRLNHPNKIKETKRNNYQKNIDKYREVALSNFYKNHDDRVKYNEKYRAEHKKDIYKKHRAYVVKRYNEDPLFRLQHNVASRIRRSLNGYNKSANTVSLLGCSIEFFKEWLQATAYANGYLDFNIDDYDRNEYHIDHMIPCSSFDFSDPEEQRKCHHWSNQQILKAQINLKKHHSLHYDWSMANG